MLTLINPTKLTAKTLIGIFIAGILVTQVGTNKAVADTCRDNNGHGDNLAASVTLSSGDVITVTKYDPTNPGNKRNQLKNLLKDGETSGNGMTIAYSNGAFELSQSQADYVVDNIPDREANCDSASSAPTSLILTGTIRDFQVSHPDFEYRVGNDRGLVTTELGPDKKPVYAHGSEGTRTTNGPDTFNQWYRDVPGVNKKKEYSIELTLQDDGTYQYRNNQFFPINGELWGNYRDNKNYHFTYELNTRFTYNGGEVFTFSGDDDVFVYIDGKRVIDIGGVHTSQTDSVSLDDLDLTVGETYDLDFFFAERHYSQSNFTITTSIELETAVDPDPDPDGDGFKNDVDPDPYKFTYAD